MNEPLLLIILFIIGVLILTVEIFIPSHGILSLVGLGFLIAAVYQAYLKVSDTAGHITVAATVVTLPTAILIAVKTFHRTPWGKRIAPANPEVCAEEFAPQYETLQGFVGQVGRTISPLRPVGICSFNGQRVNSVAEGGLIEGNVEVEAIGVRGHEVEVRPTTTNEHA